MSEKLFGTDGARGPYDASDAAGKINASTFEGLAYAYATNVEERSGTTPTFIVGGDTRSSSPELMAAVSSGAAKAGAEVWEVGIAPTPVIAWLAQEHGVNAVAVTASHNPDGDNGFKPFETGGAKPTRDILNEVETRYWESPVPAPSDTGAVISRPELTDEYVEAMVGVFGPDSLAGKLMVVDGANGAASEIAPKLYRSLGANVVGFACDPSRPINENCGAASLGGLKSLMSERVQITGDPTFIGAFAHDGDADRVMGVDRSSRTVNGNHWMHLLAKDQVGIVGTLYTNSALRQAVNARGVEFHECDNGDSYVTEMLRELTAKYGPGYTRGGEFTGHLIDTTHLPSGDGLYMAAFMATELAREGLTLDDVSRSLKLWPELLTNVRVEGGDSKKIVASDEIQQAIVDLPKGVRVVLRASGTEPLVRVWAEAEDQETVTSVVEQLSEQVRSLAA